MIRVLNYLVSLYCRHKFKSFGENLRFFPLNSSFTFESVIIGENVYIGPHAFIRTKHGSLEIQNGVVIGPFFRLYGGDHKISYDHEIAVHSTKELLSDPHIIIGRNTWIGGNVIFTKNASIGKNCIVGAGSVVTKNFPDSVVVAGNPARIIKAND